MARDWIHTPDDGRGLRVVTLNGVVIDRCVYADTKKGIVRFHDNPAKVHKYGKRIIERTLHGAVEVISRGP